MLGGPFVSLVAGVPANVTCRSRGDARPTPELLWFRDGVRLDGATFRQVRSKSLCQPLLIQGNLGVHSDHMLFQRRHGRAGIQGSGSLVRT